MQRRIYYSPQLDGLRAVCIAFTVANHVDGVPKWINGTVGVDIFFALSGFLITAILLTGETTMRGFYVRRVFRIAPVYFLAFGLTAATAWALSRFADNDAKFVELTAAWRYIVAFCGEYRPSAAGTFFGHSWTIGIEEKFYLVWPLLVVFVLRSELVLLAFLAAIPPLMAMAFGQNELRGYGGIALGSISALGFFRYNVSTIKPIFGLALVVAAYLAVTVGGATNLLIAAAAALLIPSLYGRTDARISRALAHPVMVWLGKLTFSIYMLHILVLNVVKVALPKLGIDSWPLAFALAYSGAVLAAWIVYRYFEEPMIAVGRRLAQPPRGAAMRPQPVAR